MNAHGDCLWLLLNDNSRNAEDRLRSWPDELSIVRHNEPLTLSEEPANRREAGFTAIDCDGGSRLVYQK